MGWVEEERKRTGPKGFISGNSCWRRWERTLRELPKILAFARWCIVGIIITAAVPAADPTVSPHLRRPSPRPLSGDSSWPEWIWMRFGPPDGQRQRQRLVRALGTCCYIYHRSVLYLAGADPTEHWSHHGRGEGGRGGEQLRIARINNFTFSNRSQRRRLPTHAYT